MKYILSGGFNLIAGGIVFILFFLFLIKAPYVAIPAFIISILCINNAFKLLSFYKKNKKNPDSDSDKVLHSMFADSKTFNIVSLILLIFSIISLITSPHY